MADAREAGSAMPRNAQRHPIHDNGMLIEEKGTLGVATLHAYDLTGDTEVVWWPGGLAGFDDLYYMAEN